VLYKEILLHVLSYREENSVNKRHETEKNACQIDAW
jgi:hypothetical protein